MAKKWCLGLLILLGVSHPIYAKSQSQKVVASDLNKIVAIVNNDVITQKEVDKKKLLIKQQMIRNNMAEIKDSVLQKQVLDNMIYTLLQLQLAQRNGIQVSNDELDDIISNIAKSNHLTLDQFKGVLKEREGLDFKEYRGQLREQLLVSRVQQRFLGKGIAVSDEDVKKVLRNPPEMGRIPAQYHVEDVLVAIPDDASSDQIEAAKKMATEIIGKLKQNIDIEKIEKDYGSQVQSNDLGWRRIDELPAIFASEIPKMKAGQVVGPLKAPNGLHLIKLVGMQSGQSQSAKITKEQAREIALQKKLEERLKPWLKEIRETAYVKIID